MRQDPRSFDESVADLTPPPKPWMSATESDIAWMSVRDAGIVQAVLVAAGWSHRPLRVVEWGGGRSTLGFTATLERFDIPYTWVCIEHDRSFFLRELAPELADRDGARLILSEQSDPLIGAELPLGITAVVFDAGELRPFERGLPEDFGADLDDYVGLPAACGWRIDVALVDGRKRRRCLLEASRVLAPDGRVLLHDGWRQHYQSAFAAFRFGARLGDELWLGAAEELDLRESLPDHALKNHDPAWDA